MINQLVATINYGPVRAGQPYKVLHEARDSVCLSVQGRPVYVPNYALCEYVEPEPTFEDGEEFSYDS